MDVTFTRDGWHGRMRACRGVGAAMNEAQIKAWDEEHWNMMLENAPDMIPVKHYMSYAELQLK